jgi:hypothetical protein
MRKYTYVLNNEDQETRGWADRLAQDGWAKPPLIGQQQQLKCVQPTDTLGIMAHGTSELAVIVKQGGKKRWIPSELAYQLQVDGLNPAHRTIVLLICEAGSSVNTVKGAAQLDSLRYKYNSATGTAKDAYKKQFETKAAAAPTTDMSQWSKKYLLPFGAAFVWQMQSRYPSLRVICYKHCISAHFTGGKVWLQDPATGDREATAGDQVHWMACSTK